MSDSLDAWRAVLHRRGMKDWDKPSLQMSPASEARALKFLHSLEDELDEPLTPRRRREVMLVLAEIHHGSRDEALRGFAVAIGTTIEKVSAGVRALLRQRSLSGSSPASGAA